jgi:hypothetical protein
MKGIGWRLLAAFSLIFVCSLLRGQAAGGRVPLLEPDWATRDSALIERSTPPHVSVPSHGNPVAGTLTFQQVTQAAGIIFSGRVTFIGRTSSPSGQQSASTTITFEVEHAMRGASPGQSLTVREWAGLWNMGERYRIGERVLLFLYPPSRLGLTSPVAGTMGRFAMDSRGMIVMSPEHIAILASTPVLGGKTIVSYSDVATAVQRFSGKE